jgi:alkaline phosphatase D
MRRTALSRRGFVGLASTALAGCAAPSIGTSVEHQTNVDWSAFPSGVQAGDATDSSVIISARSNEQQAFLNVAKAEGESWRSTFDEPIVVDPDGSMQLEIDGLDADSLYAVALYAADGTRRSSVTRFRTALSAKKRRPLRFGATSCFGPRNEPFPSLSVARDEDLDFFMLLGDTIYADKGDDKYRYHDKFSRALAKQGLSDMTSGTSIIATWDDHEVDNNWSWDDVGIEQRYAEALAAYRRALPQRVGPSGGIWRKLQWGDALEVFVLDVRSERDRGYISPAQMQWLQQSLLESPAAIKIIMNPVPIFDFKGTVMGPFREEDRWQGNPRERTDILEYIRDNDIQGVLWVSGDVHFGALGKVDRAGGPGDNQWEVITGPAGSSINPAARLMKKTERTPIVTPKHNWVLFEADPDTGSVALEFVGDDGQTLAEQTLQLW